MNPISIPINVTGVPTDLGSYISNIAGAALIGAALACFIFLVWGGIQWIVAGGDKGKMEQARDRITGALVGLAVTAAAWAIFVIVDNFLGISIANSTPSVNSLAPSGNTNPRCVCNSTLAGSNMCAHTGDLSPNANPCYICGANGWTRTGAPDSCANATVACDPCN